MVEVEVNNNAPTALLIPFAIHTALLVYVHLLAIVLATRLLPELDAIARQPNSFSASITKGIAWPVQLCWFLSNIVGIIMFLVELILVAYVKFFPEMEGGNRLHVGTGTLVTVVILGIFTVPFLIMLFRWITRTKIQLYEQRLDSAKALLDSMNKATPVVDVEQASLQSYEPQSSDLQQRSHVHNILRNTQV